MDLLDAAKADKEPKLPQAIKSEPKSGKSVSCIPDPSPLISNPETSAAAAGKKPKKKQKKNREINKEDAAYLFGMASIVCSLLITLICFVSVGLHGLVKRVQEIETATRQIECAAWMYGNFSTTPAGYTSLPGDRTTKDTTPITTIPMSTAASTVNVTIESIDTTESNTTQAEPSDANDTIPVSSLVSSSSSKSTTRRRRRTTPPLDNSTNESINGTLISI